VESTVVQDVKLYSQRFIFQDVNGFRVWPIQASLVDNINNQASEILRIVATNVQNPYPLRIITGNMNSNFDYIYIKQFMLPILNNSCYR
jgi:hypothetical protein